MAKWYAGMVLSGIVIVGILISMMYYPWFSIETEYPPNSAVDSMTVTYKLDEYEVSSIDDLAYLEPRDRHVEAGTFQIKDAPEDGGWDGDYADFANSGRPAQLEVYINTYYLLLITIIIAVVTTILIPLAGLGKIPPKAAIGVAILMTVFAILGPIYYGIFMPIAFDNDMEEIYRESKAAALASNQTSNITAPEPLQSVWGDSNNIDVYRQVGIDGAQSHWRPGLGWWIGIIMIFLAIVSIGMIEGPKRPGYGTDRYRDDAYGDRRDDYDYDDRRRPPPRRDDYYDDYPPRDYDRRGPPRGRDYYDDRPPGGRTPAYGGQGEWEPPPRQDDYYSRPPPPPQRRPPPPGY